MFLCVSLGQGVVLCHVFVYQLGAGCSAVSCFCVSAWGRV